MKNNNIKLILSLVFVHDPVNTLNDCCPRSGLYQGPCYLIFLNIKTFHQERIEVYYVVLAGSYVAKKCWLMSNKEITPAACSDFMMKYLSLLSSPGIKTDLANTLSATLPDIFASQLTISTSSTSEEERILLTRPDVVAGWWWQGQEWHV